MSKLLAIRIYNDIGRLRKAIRREGTPAIRAAWENIEPHVAVFLQSANNEDTK